jgi:hypothetical protein
VIRIAIGQAAFDALAATLPLGSVGYEREPDEKGERLIWVEARVADQLSSLRGPGETWSDVILRLVEIEAKGRVDRLRRAQTHLRMAARRGAQKPGFVDMVSPIFLAPASVFTEAGGV